MCSILYISSCLSLSSIINSVFHSDPNSNSVQLSAPALWENGAGSEPFFVKLKSKLSLKVCCKLLLIENTSLFGNQMSCIFQNLLFCDIFGNNNGYGELNFSFATTLGWYYSWSRRANGKIARVIMVMEAMIYLYCGEVCVKKIFTFSNGLCVCLWRFILTFSIRKYIYKYLFFVSVCPWRSGWR